MSYFSSIITQISNLITKNSLYEPISPISSKEKKKERRWRRMERKKARVCGGNRDKLI